MHQKKYYDKKLHGLPYKREDLVWLHSSVVNRGQHHKLHHPWTRPYQVLKQISKATYRIKQVDGKRQCKVVHFNSQKPCLSNIGVKVNINKATSKKQKNVEHLSEQVDSEQVQMPSVENDLQLIHYDDDIQQTVDAQQPTTM